MMDWYSGSDSEEYGVIDFTDAALVERLKVLVAKIKDMEDSDKGAGIFTSRSDREVYLEQGAVFREILSRGNAYEEVANSIDMDRIYYTEGETTLLLERISALQEAVEYGVSSSLLEGAL